MSWKRIEPQENLDDIILNIVDEELVQEGIGNLISLGALAFLLGSSGIVNAAEFKQELGKVAKDKQVEQGGKVTVTKKDIANAVEKSKVEDPKIGRWRRSQILNIVARTLYMEAREDGETGLNLSMTVIWNRAGGGMASQLAEECLRPSQFSCWNGKPKAEKQPSTYEIEFPKCVKTGHGQEYNLWKTCLELATQAVNGTFTPENDYWNAYYNPKKCCPYWASQLIEPKTVGHHIVGELKDQTRHASNLRKTQQKPTHQTHAQQTIVSTKTKEYTVKDGDTLYAIAGKNMKKVKQIKQLNDLKSDVLKPGQKLSIPA